MARQRSGNITPAVTQAEHIGPEDTGDNIEAKRAAGYVWNAATSLWERSSSGVALAIELATDSNDGNIQYLGKAAVGTATSAATWQVQKINQNSGVVITWADGNSNYDNVFDNRESLTYS